MKQPLGCMFTKRAPNRGGVGCAGVGCGESFRGGVGHTGVEWAAKYYLHN